MSRKLWQQVVFTADDSGTWQVEDGKVPVCERIPRFLVAVAMVIEPVRLPAVMETDGWLQNAAWVLRN